MLELIPNEVAIAKKGVLDGARAGWADKLGIPTNSISDEVASTGIIFLNEDIKIERIM